MNFFVSLFFFAILLSPVVHAQDSVKDVHTRKKFVKAFAAPAILTVAGLASNGKVNGNYLFINRHWVRDERNKNFAGFHTTADNYLQYAGIAAVYALDLTHVNTKAMHDVANQTALIIKSEILLSLITYPLKNTTHVVRPDGSNDQSFPSGHTAQAFAAATFLHKEYGHVSKWYSVGAYTVAAGVGALRILNNKHWISDVLVGAGVGIFSTNLVYLTHKNKWGKHGNHVSLVPTYSKGAGMYFCYQFR